MFEFVRSYPETPTTPARYSVAASTAGYDALVLRNHTDATDDDRPRFDGSSLSPAAADEIGSEAPTDIYSGVEIRVGAGEVDRLHGFG
ncbi:MAG: hypothetical protein SV760_02005 [Halobacteria archaeon]|nr:hypothetical protein [Halobacteria archaeon]